LSDLDQTGKGSVACDLCNEQTSQHTNNPSCKIVMKYYTKVVKQNDEHNNKSYLIKQLRKNLIIKPYTIEGETKY